MDNNLPSYEPPSLEEAKKFFLTTLPHRIIDSGQKTGYRLANEGEIIDDTTGKVADLYDFFNSPAEALSEFGIGIGLYFKTLKALFLVLFLCAFINLIAIYENMKFNLSQSDIDAHMKLFPNDEELQPTPVELYGSVYGAEYGDLKFSKQCAADITITVIFAFFLFLSIKAQTDIVENIDKSQQTTQDYSVVIKHPPEFNQDGTEITADTFKQFFSKFGEVASVSITRKNGGLLRAISVREHLKSKINKMKLSLAAQGVSEDSQVSNLNVFQKFLQPYGYYEDLNYLQSEYDKIDDLVNKMTTLKYKTWRVFITFNRQHDQVNCIQKCFYNKADKLKGIDPSHHAYFNGNVLNVKEAHEPSDVIYVMNDYSVTRQLISWATSFFVCIVVMVINYYIINSLLKTGGVAAPIFISIINSGLPVLMKMLTMEVEIHYDNGNRQSSLLLKLVSVRCINAAVLIYLASPFDSTFALTRIQAVQNTLLADAVLTPLLRIFDPYILYRRYYLSRYATTQAEMNNLWRSQDWTLAERYTDIIKSIFMSFFYAVLLPSGLFISCFTVISTYFLDKYSMFRIWRRPPLVGASLGIIARYFLMATLWVHLITSRIYFANWPYTGPWKNQGTEEADCNFLTCKTNSDMTNDQKKVVILYSVVCTISFVIVAILTINYVIGDQLLKALGWKRADTEEIDDSHIPEFKSLAGVPIYIPSVENPELIDLIICAPLDNVTQSFLPESIITDDGNTLNETITTTENFPNLKTLKDLEGVFGSVYCYNERAVHKPRGSLVRRGSSTAQAIALAQQLPKGWEKKTTHDGKEYFLDHNTKTTHWTLPVEVSKTIYENVSKSTKMKRQGPIASFMEEVNHNDLKAVVPMVVDKKESTEEGLPANWEIKYTKEGKKYYVNHNDKTTHWELP